MRGRGGKGEGEEGEEREVSDPLIRDDGDDEGEGRTCDMKRWTLRARSTVSLSASDSSSMPRMAMMSWRPL